MVLKLWNQAGYAAFIGLMYFRAQPACSLYGEGKQSQRNCSPEYDSTSKAILLNEKEKNSLPDE